MDTRQEHIRTAVNMGMAEDDAALLVDEILAQWKKLKASGRTDAPKEAMSRWFMEKTEFTRRRALAQERQAALDINIRERIQRVVDTVKAQGGDVVDAMEALLAGSSKYYTGSRESASRLASSLTALWGGSMASQLDRAGVLPLLKQDANFPELVIREIITPESTGDKAARQTADIFSRWLVYMRRQLNEYGAELGEMDDYVPQSHDSLKLRRAGEAEWVRYMAERLNWERTFPDLPEEEVLTELGEMYQDIVTGIRRSQEEKARAGFFASSPGLAPNLGRERAPHFKDAAGAVEYNRRFGNGNIVRGMLGKLETYARRLALMRTFGPNPEAMIKGFLEREIQAVRQAHGDPARILNAWQERRGRLAQYYRALAGEAGTPENITVARIASAARGAAGMTRLGDAFLSSFADIGIKAAAARHAGEGWLEAWHTEIETRFERFRNAEKRELGRQLGVYTQALLGELYSKFAVTDALSGRMTRWMDAFFKISGLTDWTEAHRAAYAFHLSSRLAHFAREGADGLNRDLAVALRRNGLMDRLDLLGKMVDEVEGETYVIPENAYRLTDADLEGHLPEHLRESGGMPSETWEAARAAELARMRENLARDVMGYFADETGYAEREPDAQPRAAIYDGTRPDALAGEMPRFARQFKNFPVACRQWANPAQARRITGDIPGFIHFFAASTVLGYVNMTARAVSKGREPRDVREHPVEITLAAIMRGGALGLLGDFFLGMADRFAHQLTPNLNDSARRVLSTVDVLTGRLARGEFRDGGETAVRGVVDDLPFVNLWYTRLAMEYLVNYHVREWLNPDALRHGEKKMWKEFHQKYLTIDGIDQTPGRHIPSGEGNRKDRTPGLA